MKKIWSAPFLGCSVVLGCCAQPTRIVRKYLENKPAQRISLLRHSHAEVTADSEQRHEGRHHYFLLRKRSLVQISHRTGLH
jgi:hypothetical protein